MSEIPPGTMFEDLVYLEIDQASQPEPGGVLALDDAGEQFNPPMDGVSSDFFTELDAYTEYWSLYDVIPDGRYLAHYSAAQQVVAAWGHRAAATTPDDKATTEQTLRAELDKAGVAEALRALDELMISLVIKHCPGPDGNADLDAYLTVVEAFARDVLPPDEDRLKRVTDADPFTTEGEAALRHRMNGASMWFTWAAVVDAAAILDEADGTGDRTPVRAALLAGCAAGSALDFTFRGTPNDPRGTTRPEYHPDEATLQSLRTAAREWSADLNQARDQARDLARIFGVK